MSDLSEKEKIAIERMRSFAPKNGEPYYLCYSGGKDSDVIRILAQLADVKSELHHNLTSADAPVTVRYVRSIPDMHVDVNHYADGTRITMWNLIPRKLIPPTRIVRYCCEKLKEYGGEGRLKITGVRWAESLNRKNNADVIRIFGKTNNTKELAENEGAKYTETTKGGIILHSDNDQNRRLVEHCYRDRSTTVNPIVDWSDSDVWEFLHHYGCASNPLYQCGKNRIGCLLCPMNSSGQKQEAQQYPKYAELYIRAFDRMVEEREKRGLKNSSGWRDGESVFRWWIGEDPNQITFDDYFKIMEEVKDDEGRPDRR